MRSEDKNNAQAGFTDRITSLENKVDTLLAGMPTQPQNTPEPYPPDAHQSTASPPNPREIPVSPATRDVVAAQVEMAYTKERHNRRKPFRTLVKLDENSDLLLWNLVDEEGSKKEIVLRRLLIYPALMLDTGRVAMVRPGHDRMTYFRCDGPNKPRLTIGNEEFTCSLFLPQRSVDKGNVVICLDSGGGKVCKIYFRLGPESMRVNSISFSDEYEEWEADRLRGHLENDQQTIEMLLSEAFKPSRYDRLGIREKKLNAYIGDGEYQVRLAAFGKHPFYIIKQVRPAAWVGVNEQPVPDSGTRAA